MRLGLGAELARAYMFASFELRPSIGSLLFCSLAIGLPRIVQNKYTSTDITLLFSQSHLQSPDYMHDNDMRAS